MLQTRKAEKRNLTRKAFSYYMQVVDDTEEKPLGYLTDISTHGFRLDCRQPLQVERTFAVRLDLTDEVADKSSLVLVARNRWCKRDELDPFVYNVGFQIVNMSPEDVPIFKRLVERYGA